MLVVSVLFFFFKQKTAYEMRISDWSSDVCSSDLRFPSARTCSSSRVMASLTALDIIVLLLVGGGLVFGFLRGFIFEVLSLFAWVAAIIALKLFHGPVTAWLVEPVGTGPGAAVLAFILVFGVVFVVGKLLARRIGGATRNSVVGPVDRVL